MSVYRSVDILGVDTCCTAWGNRVFPLRLLGNKLQLKSSMNAK